MKRCLVVQIFALVTALTISSGLCAQTSPKTDAKKAGTETLARTSDGAPDFSGVWEGTCRPAPANGLDIPLSELFRR